MVFLLARRGNISACKVIASKVIVLIYYTSWVNWHHDACGAGLLVHYQPGRQLGGSYVMSMRLL